ncbi:MAG TPA: DUF4234 domain-containing protein [Acidimicrobiales bacterium]|nr:DUF4234 domain-containing protein [Acidimicrobiales bacterium]
MSAMPPPPPPESSPSGLPPAGWGPIGKRRPIGTQIVLSIVTLGIYGVYWVYVNHEEIKQHSGEGIGGALGAVIYVFVGIVTLFLLPIEIQRMYERDGRQSPVGPVTAAWILLFIIPWYVKCQDALNEYWASKGALPPTGWTS